MKTTTEHTEALLKIVEIEFPQIGQISYLREEYHPFLTRVLMTLKKAAPEIAAMKKIVEQTIHITTQDQAPAASSPAPSSAPLPVPEKARSTHTPADAPSTADTASSTDHKSDTSGKRASSSARMSGLNRARAAAAASRKAASRKAAPVRPSKGSVAPPTEPPSTPEPGTI